ncbi:MAG: DUF4178 domain-containing protein [Verrucomicrobiota bacterium]
MSFANPTPLRVGMSGTLSGKPYRVAGRVVMGMDEGGETYYWNEFNLVDDAGDSVTLVYEETEHGGEWRLFTLFEPDTPMSVQEAASKRVGDLLALNNLNLRITLVDESRVYRIEGQAPEGVEVGDTAHYFNAESGRKMIVASWTGNELEFYQGVTLSAGLVASAFNLDLGKLKSGFSASSASSLASGLFGGNKESSSNWIFKLLLGVIVLATLFGGYASCRSSEARITPAKTFTADPHLKLDSAGTLDGKSYQIKGHAIVELAEVGRIRDEHEFALSHESERNGLLVFGMSGGKDWVLFTPMEPMNALTPVEAAVLKAGETVNLNGYIVPIQELFQATPLEISGSGLDEWTSGKACYGFRAQSGSTLLLVRWNDAGITFYSGKVVPEKAVFAAFQRTR